MDKEWVAKKKAEYLRDLAARKQKVYNFITSLKFMSDEEKRELIAKLDSVKINDTICDTERESEPLQLIDLKIDLLFPLTMKHPEIYEMYKIGGWRSMVEELELDKLCSRLEYPELYDGGRLLDSEVIEVDGDIIITDPCYIMKELDISSRPKEEEYFLYENESDYPDFDAATGISERYLEDDRRFKEAYTKWCADHPEDWEVCGFGDNMEALGFHKYICRNTLYGDWSCTTFNTDTKEKIGEFCADGGLVAVFPLDDVLRYNPDFDYYTERPWTTTWIKDFKGTVQIVVKPSEAPEDESEEYEVQVVGHGINKVTGLPLNFVGYQTGL